MNHFQNDEAINEKMQFAFDLVMKAATNEALENLTTNDIGLIKADIAIKIKNGWTIGETYRYLRNMEEISPLLAEDIAINNMNKIRNEVMLRLGLDNLAT